VTPLVTVVVLNFNYAGYALECLDSVRAQTYPNIQLVVIDDGSTDGSRDILRTWVDAHWPEAVTDLSDENHGLQARVAQGLELADGCYYQIFSTDDRMMSHKIATQVARLEADPEVALCYSDMMLIDRDGHRLGRRALDDARAAGNPPRSGWVLDRALARAGFCAPSWLLRRDAVRAVGGYDAHIYTEDTPLLVKLAPHYRFIYVDDPLVEYRWHGANLSTRFGSTAAHRLSWCELLGALDPPEYARQAWLDAYRTRVRMLVVGNPRAQALPHTRRLAAADPSLRNRALLAATSLGLGDAHARRLLAARDAVRRRLPSRPQPD
jgi:alpha-1,3-rhamnosyltransferase